MLENVFNLLKPLLLHGFERFWLKFFLFVLFVFIEVFTLVFFYWNVYKYCVLTVMESSYPISFEYSLTIFANCYTFSRFLVYVVAVITRLNPDIFPYLSLPLSTRNKNDLLHFQNIHKTMLYLEQK